MIIIQVHNQYLSKAVQELAFSKGYSDYLNNEFRKAIVDEHGDSACLVFHTNKIFGYGSKQYINKKYPDTLILSAKTDWDKIEAYFNEPKFEIGDRVKIVKNESSSQNKIGVVGTIIEITRSRGLPYRVIVNGVNNYGNWHKASDLIHTTEPLTVANTTLKLELNREYTAEIDKAKRIVKVGCSEFTFDKINELSEAIK
jgi:hypothetical protein